MNDATRVWVSSRKCKKRISYRLRWVDPGGGGWRSKTIGTDRKHAEREAARLEDQLERGTYRHLQRITWQEFVADHAGIKARCDELCQLHQDGKLTPLMAPVRPLADAGAVLSEMAGRGTTGKLLLKP